jgi:hypothetical protein
MYRRFLRRVRLRNDKTGNGGRVYGCALQGTVGEASGFAPMTIDVVPNDSIFGYGVDRVVIGGRATDLLGYDFRRETPSLPCFIDLVIPKPNAAEESVIGSPPAYPERA